MRAPTQWYGGKGNLAGKIAPFVPYSERYVEPYCGMASLFFYRERSKVEALNDLNDHVITLFRVLQDKDKCKELQDRLDFTLYARSELTRALTILGQPTKHDEISRAWAAFVALNSTINAKASTAQATPSSWAAHGSALKSWPRKSKECGLWHARLAGVSIDNKDAVWFIRKWDSPETVIYCDPPYVLGTRREKSGYRFEQNDAHHRKLVEVLLGLKGACVLSGYDSPLYHPLVSVGWRKELIEVHCPSASWDGTNARRTEVLWINPRASQMLAEQKK